MAVKCSVRFCELNIVQRAIVGTAREEVRTEAESACLQSGLGDSTTVRIWTINSSLLVQLLCSPKQEVEDDEDGEIKIVEKNLKTAFN